MNKHTKPHNEYMKVHKEQIKACENTKNKSKHLKAYRNTYNHIEAHKSTESKQKGK